MKKYISMAIAAIMSISTAATIASAEDAPIVDYHMNFIRNRKKVPAATNAALTVNDPNHDPNGPRQCYAEAMRLKSFHPAEEEHQG